jgi:hypothetical protein
MLALRLMRVVRAWRGFRAHRERLIAGNAAVGRRVDRWRSSALGKRTKHGITRHVRTTDSMTQNLRRRTSFRISRAAL